MNNSEVIHAPGERTAEKPADEPVVRFLGFHLAEHQYAFYAEQVREICIDLPMFFIPFVPPYVRGFINRHGEPYTVIDLSVFLGSAPLDSSTYLILNLKEDQLAFLISGVEEIIKARSSQVHPAPVRDGEFSMGSVELPDGMIEILSPAHIVAQLERDLEE